MSKRLGCRRRARAVVAEAVVSVARESLLEQLRELHQVADEVTRERAKIDANVRARLRWDDRSAP